MINCSSLSSFYVIAPPPKKTKNPPPLAFFNPFCNIGIIGKFVLDNIDLVGGARLIYLENEEYGIYQNYKCLELRINMELFIQEKQNERFPTF